jgi:signal recognition particle receptor subunit beta
LYLLGHPPGRFTGRTIAYLGQRSMPLSQVGFVLLMDSTRPENDRENMTHMRDIEAHNFPYVVALSKQDLPNARTLQQMREMLAIPDEIKLLSYDWKDPKSTKQVVLELVKLFPRDELAQRVIDGLKAKIDEA